MLGDLPGSKRKLLTTQSRKPKRDSASATRKQGAPKDFGTKERKNAPVPKEKRELAVLTPSV